MRKMSLPRSTSRSKARHLFLGLTLATFTAVLWIAIEGAGVPATEENVHSTRNLLNSSPSTTTGKPAPTDHTTHYTRTCERIMKSWREQPPNNTDDLKAGMHYTPPAYPRDTADTRQNKFKRGVVMYSGGERLPMALVVARTIRKMLHSDIPIEIWYLRDEATSRTWDEMVQRSKKHNVFLMEIPEACHFKHFNWGDRWSDEAGKILSDNSGKVLLKPLVVALSSFEEAVFLDDDCIPVVDPSTFFSFIQHPQTAAFFPDMWSLMDTAPIWSVLPYPSQFPNSAYSQDSGIFVVCKTCDSDKGWAALLRTGYLNYHHKTYYPAIYKLFAKSDYMRAAIGAGDKDTFQVGWMMERSEFARLGPVVLLGRLQENCGGVMGQLGPGGKLVAFHMTLHKLHYHDWQAGRWRTWGQTTHLGLQKVFRRNMLFAPGNGIFQQEALWLDGHAGHASCLQWINGLHPEPNTLLSQNFEQDFLSGAEAMYGTSLVLRYMAEIREEKKDDTQEALF